MMDAKEVPSKKGEIRLRFVNFLIKPASSACNLRCRYCFYADEAQNRTQACMGLMSRETAQKLIDRAYEALDPGGTVTFAFQGGEPTVAGLDFFRAFADYARSHRPDRAQVLFSIQTNGTLLDEEWVRFFRQEAFLVGLSLDGCREIHNANRVDAAGKDTWGSCLEALSLLQREKVPVNALCVVTGTCARHPKKVYESLKSLNLSYLQFIACLDPIEGERGSQPWSLSPKAYGRFLCQLFDLWYRDWERGNYHSIRLFDDYIHILLGDGFSTCATCGRCGGYFVAEADGSLYPCDFYALDSWKLGTLASGTLEELLRGEVYTRFLDQGRELPPKCADCRWKNLCGGGCKNDWVWQGGKPENYFCQSFSTLFDYAFPRMLRIARAEERHRR